MGTLLGVYTGDTFPKRLSRDKSRLAVELDTGQVVDPLREGKFVLASPFHFVNGPSDGVCSNIHTFFDGVTSTLQVQVVHQHSCSDARIPFFYVGLSSHI